MSTVPTELLDRTKFREDLTKYQKVLRDLNKNPAENADKITRIQRWMEKACYRALVSDPSYYLETGLDSIVWRDCFYKPIESERAKIKDLTKSQLDANPSKLLELIQRALDYYVSVYRQLKDIPAIDQSRTPSSSSSTRFSQKTKVIITCNLFIHIGDLYRYEAQYSVPQGTIPNFEKAESAYKQVIALDSGSGIGHHQLAVLAVNSNADILAVYRYIRSIACSSPFAPALKNLRVLFSKNEKSMSSLIMEPHSKKEGVTAFTKLFIELMHVLCDGVGDAIRFNSLMVNCLQLFDVLLRYDALSTQFVFRVIMIAIFAACNLWNNGADKESSQSGILSDSCLNGWLCLMNLITRVFIHTLSESNGSTRHMATIRLFMMWLELQKADGFRPKYMASEASFCSTSNLTLFLDVEQRLWRNLVALMNRLPLKETVVKDTAPLRYEVEIRGYLPFRGVFDNIAGSHTFCNDEESLIRYMIAICVSFNHLKDDPRCPVHIDKDNHHQYYVLNPHQSRDPFRSVAFDNLPSFSAISVNGEDDSPSMLNSSLFGIHSRNVSNSTRLSGSPNDPFGSRSSSQSTSNLYSRVGSSLSIHSHSRESSSDRLQRTMSPFRLTGDQG